MDQEAARPGEAGPGAEGRREDFREILRLVRPGSRVLDIGCGDGLLLSLLAREKAVLGQGLEIRPEAVAAGAARGLTVTQGDADRDLDALPGQGFDYAVLTYTLQQTRDPCHVLGQATRIAGQAIVAIPNLGHWRARLALALGGRKPATAGLPGPWWGTADIHPCTLRDFTDLCDALGLRIDAAAALSPNAPARPVDARKASANLLSEAAVFLLSRREAPVPVPAPAPAATPAERKDLFG